MTVEISDDPATIHIPDLVALFAGTWWAASRTEADTERILAGSDVVMTARDHNRTVGFARVLTDGIYLALILDVIVAPGARGTGVGVRLVDAVLAHPKVEGVRSVELVCQSDLVPFYERWGFTAEVGGSRLMRRTADPGLVSPRPSPSPSASRPASPPRAP